MSQRLTLVCSGATVATRQASFALDEPLERRALPRVAALSRQLRRADRLWTSPALRARQTAAALALPAVAMPALRDQDFGAWAGKSFDHMREQEPEGIAAWLADPEAAPHGGESLSALARRVSVLMDGLLGEHGHTIAVTHAAVIRAAMLHVLGAPLAAFWRIDIEPLSVTEFRGDGRRWILRASGVTAPKIAKSPTAGDIST